MMADYFVNQLRQTLKRENRAWEFLQVEAPLLTPLAFINIFVPAVMAFNDVPVFDDVALRPETTMGSYQYARWLLEATVKNDAGTVGETLVQAAKVLEVAIGTDRCVFNFLKKEYEQLRSILEKLGTSKNKNFTFPSKNPRKLTMISMDKPQ
jgi:hypothetical protein